LEKYSDFQPIIRTLPLLWGIQARVAGIFPPDARSNTSLQKKVTPFGVVDWLKPGAIPPRRTVARRPTQARRWEIYLEFIGIVPQKIGIRIVIRVKMGLFKG
jgi:hypothetical protein